MNYSQSSTDNESCNKRFIIINDKFATSEDSFRAPETFSNEGDSDVCMGVAAKK